MSATPKIRNVYSTTLLQDVISLLSSDSRQLVVSHLFCIFPDVLVWSCQMNLWEHQLMKKIVLATLDFAYLLFIFLSYYQISCTDHSEHIPQSIYHVITVYQIRKSQSCSHIATNHR